MDYNDSMNWLILSAGISATEKFSEYIEKNNSGKKADLVLFTKNKDGYADKFSSKELKKIISSVNAADHFILLDADELSENPDFMFLFGLVTSKGQFVLCQGKDAANLKVYDGSGCVFTEEKKPDALKVLKGNFKQLAENDVKRTARNELFERGLPFNADCMVHFMEKDKPEIVELVYRAGLDLNSYTEDGVPVLCAATRCDNLEYVKWLLKHNADVNIISKDRGYSPVMDAVWKKNLDMVKLYIKNGADLNVMSSDGQPILVLAVGNGSSKIVETLLKAGADPDVKDGMGMSARAYANLFKNTELMKIMAKFPKAE